MSPATLRKIKAIMVVALLSVAEGHRIQVQAGTSSWGTSRSGGDAYATAILRVHKWSKAGSDKSEASRVAAQMTNTLDSMWTHLFEKTGAMLSDPHVQQRGNLMLHTVEALMRDSVLHEQAESLAELVGAMNDNPNKQAVATRVAKHVESMMTDPNFQGQLEAIASQFDADPHLSEQLSAMRDLEEQVLEKMGAMENEPSALVEVAESNAQKRSRSALNPVRNVLGRVRGPHPGPVPVADLSKQTLGLRGRKQSMREPGISRAALPRLANDWTLDAGPSAAKTPEAGQSFFGALGALSFAHAALLRSKAAGVTPRDALNKGVAALAATGVLLRSEAAMALGLPSAMDRMSETLAGVVAVDGGTVGLDVSFPAFLAVILGLFIPVVFLVTTYIQSDAQGTATTFRQPDSIGGTRYEDE